MADLSGEYWQAFSISWACFAMGVAVFNLVPKTWLSVVYVAGSAGIVAGGPQLLGGSRLSRE
jgi:energy-converting hydrogenase Eha subunit G